MTSVDVVPVVALVLDANQRSLWYVALGIGAVVLIVVIGCLTLLLLFVRDIDAGVAELWTEAKRMAGNTATTWQLDATAGTLQELRDELRRHDELLSER